jgi:hypothetical protein
MYQTKSFFSYILLFRVNSLLYLINERFDNKHKVQQQSQGLTALTSEMDFDQTVSGFPPVTSAVFLIANSFW